MDLRLQVSPSVILILSRHLHVMKVKLLVYIVKVIMNHSSYDLVFFLPTNLLLQFAKQNHVLMGLCSSMVHRFQELVGLKFVWMANGELSVTISGTIMMLALYVEIWDSEQMVKMMDFCK